ncbi:RNA-directed DNA polymerase, eukaryota [Tanacetum coccineum]|uniref:RNA-directed DNA polymerase, eukaryota n=1 Tax=Tanacetum coccineum TaxID=301880 RepID=A0ABQ5GWQ0_9ASTR
MVLLLQIYHYWFKLDGFDKMVKDSWKNSTILKPNAMIYLKKKLQSLKNDIKLWTKEAKSQSSSTKLSIQNKLFEVDRIIDQGGSNEEILNRRSTPLKDLHNTKAIEALDIAQKAKILKYPWQRRSGCCYLVFLVRLYALEECKLITVVEKIRHDGLSSSYRRPPRGGAEEEQQSVLQARVTDLVLPHMLDRWTWSFDSSSDFSVTSLPTRLDLSLRSVDISSILCPLCDASVESSSHLFFTCPLVCQVRSKVSR